MGFRSRDSRVGFYFWLVILLANLLYLLGGGRNGFAGIAALLAASFVLEGASEWYRGGSQELERQNERQKREGDTTDDHKKAGQ